MPTSSLVREYKTSDPDVQRMLEDIALRAYALGRRDQGVTMTQIAEATDARINASLMGLGETRRVNSH